MGDGTYDCKACAESPYKLEQLGHDRAPAGVWDSNLITDEPLTRCPIRVLQLAKPDLQSEVIRWKEVYFHEYVKGHYLVEGGISAQPARWLAAMQYLEGLHSLMEAKYMELHKGDGGTDAS